MKIILEVEDDPSMRWLLKYLLHDKYEIIVENKMPVMHVIPKNGVRKVPPVFASGSHPPSSHEPYNEIEFCYLTIGSTA